MVLFALLAALFAFGLLSDPAWAQANVTKTDQPDPVELGNFLLYTVTVTNTAAGPQPVTIQDNLPENVTLISAAITGGTCQTFPSAEPEVVCTVTLNAAPNNTTTAQILVSPQQTGQITNTAQVLSTASVVLGTANANTNVIPDRNEARDNRRERIRDFRRNNPRFRGDALFRQYEEDELSQEEQLFEAEQDLEESEETNGEDTFGDFEGEDLDEDDDPPVSANANDGVAEASTPGAVARSGDPDELQPLRSTPDNVVNEVPTSGPLPNTGGMSLLYWLLPLAGLLILAGLPVYRWAKRRE